MSVLTQIYEASDIIPDYYADFQREFDITNHSRYFSPQGDLPVYQGAMIWQYDNRYNFYVRAQRKWHRAKLEDVEFRDVYPLCPKSWVSERAYGEKFGDRLRHGLPEYYYYRIASRRQSSLSN